MVNPDDTAIPVTTVEDPEGSALKIVIKAFAVELKRPFFTNDTSLLADEAEKVRLQSNSAAKR